MKNQALINDLKLIFYVYNSRQRLEILEHLMKEASEYGIDFNIRNASGQTLLDIVTLRNDTEVLELFKKYGYVETSSND